MIFVSLLNIILISYVNCSIPYQVNDLLGLGAEFDGIGGISGGGATSKLLINYKEPYRSDILDYLFKPNFGASLQILKVEIGGDSQSTDGSESSHMHERSDYNFNRGYEWWLMKEAKKRNKNIKLYGLPWTFPGWLGHNTTNPFYDLNDLINYTTSWIVGAKTHHNLTIDYIGVWNERKCDSNYVKLLRKTLDNMDLKNIGIVVPDAMDWSIVDTLQQDPDYLASVVAIGQHYPGATSPATAQKLGVKLWASEDFSAPNDLSGGGCWARVLNEGPISGYLTSFIAWNLVTSYYWGLPYSSSSLMTANMPWAGHYSVDSPIWITAHHTQFYDVGWRYLLNKVGVGRLRSNGTYISLTSPSLDQLTIVVEMMDPLTSPCFYSMPKFNVSEEELVTFQLDGSFADIEEMNVWFSHLDFSKNSLNETILFKKLATIQIIDKKITFLLKKNDIYTFTTRSGGVKGVTEYPPLPSAQFPLPYFEDFENYSLGAEPFNFAQQSGSYEVTLAHDLSHHKVMSQVVLRPPIDTCYIIMSDPPNLIGNYLWYNTKVQTDVYVDSASTKGIMLASQVSDGGCDINQSSGIHFILDFQSQFAAITRFHNGTGVYLKKYFKFEFYKKWFTMALDVKDKYVEALINDKIILATLLDSVPSPHGFVALGPINFAAASFDNFLVSRAEVFKGPVDLKRYKKKPRF